MQQILIVDDPHWIEFQLLTIDLLTDHHVSELHLIASQRASLISKNILHLTQLLINAHRSASHTSLIQLAIHLLISRHEIPLKNLHELNRNDQTYGNKSAVKNKKRSKRNSRLPNTTRFSPCDVVHKSLLTNATKITINRTPQTAKTLQQKYQQNKAVHNLLDVARLRCRLTTVHHYSSVSSSVNHHSNRPIRVFQFTTSQHHVLFVHSLSDNQISQPQLNLSLKGLNFSRRLNTFDFSM